MGRRIISSFIPDFNAILENNFEQSIARTAFHAVNGCNWKATNDPLTGRARRVYGGAVPYIFGPANGLNGGTSSADLEIGGNTVCP